MYIVRWLMGHPIIATWFVGAIAILLSISNSGGDKKDLHVEDHAANQEQVVITDSTKSLDSPSAVTSALIESDEKAVTAKESAEVETEVAEMVESATAEPVNTEITTESSATTESQDATVNDEQANSVLVEEVVTETTVDSTVATSRSYPDGLATDTTANAVVEKTEVEVTEAPAVEETPAANEVVTEKEPVEEATGTENQADVAVAATEAASTIEETPKPEEAQVDTESIQDLGQSSTEEMLLMAREAYWNNGLEEASQIYMQLIELEPTVIEHRGELGNVYWRQGYPKKAAELYSEIAIPMIEQGNSERVANMIGFIGLFYPDRAAEIHKRLQATTH